MSAAVWLTLGPVVQFLDFDRICHIPRRCFRSDIDSFTLRVFQKRNRGNKCRMKLVLHSPLVSKHAIGRGGVVSTNVYVFVPSVIRFYVAIILFIKQIKRALSLPP